MNGFAAIDGFRSVAQSDFAAARLDEIDPVPAGIACAHAPRVGARSSLAVHPYAFSESPQVGAIPAIGRLQAECQQSPEIGCRTADIGLDAEESRYSYQFGMRRRPDCAIGGDMDRFWGPR